MFKHIGSTPTKNSDIELTSQEILDDGMWEHVSGIINGQGIFLSKIDLETDLVNELPDEINDALGKTDIDSSIKYLQGKKALRMRGLLLSIEDKLYKLHDGELVRPLRKLIELRKS